MYFLVKMGFKLKNLLLFILLIGMSFSLTSCKVLFPNRMFKQGNYEYFQVGKEQIDEYTIEKGDLLSLQIFSREGFDLIDVLPNETGGGMSGGVQGRANQVSYLVEQDGYVELPLFGRTYVVGLTENQLEDFIEEKCRSIFNEPYAVLNVANRRAFVFKGSSASVVSLNEGPTSLLEVIAKSGGIGDGLKAYKIKIIRGDLKNPEIINIDLSSMEGLQNSNMVVQSNDVIYIEQRLRVINGVLREITPILSIVTSSATLVILLNRL